MTGDQPKLPLIPSHEIIGTVMKASRRGGGLRPGQLVGISGWGIPAGNAGMPAGMENLCETSLFTGYTIDGGYAEYMVADERFCFVLEEQYLGPDSVPLLCAGLMGFQACRMV